MWLFSWTVTVENPFPFGGAHDRAVAQSVTYDQAPEMSAFQIAKGAVRSIARKENFICWYEFCQCRYGRPLPEIWPPLSKLVKPIDKVPGGNSEHVLAKDGASWLLPNHGRCGRSFLNLQTGNRQGTFQQSVPLIIIANSFMGQAGPSGDPAKWRFLVFCLRSEFWPMSRQPS